MSNIQTLEILRSSSIGLLESVNSGKYFLQVICDREDDPESEQRFDYILPLNNRQEALSISRSCGLEIKKVGDAGEYGWLIGKKA